MCVCVWISTQLSMLFFDMESYVQHNEMSLGLQTENTLLKRAEIRLLPILLQWHFCLSIFLTNAHKLVFRFLSPKMHNTTINPRHILKTKSTFFRLFGFRLPLVTARTSFLFRRFFFLPLLILVFCCNNCRGCHYGSGYICEPFR